MFDENKLSFLAQHTQGIFRQHYLRLNLTLKYGTGPTKRHLEWVLEVLDLRQPYAPFLPPPEDASPAPRQALVFFSCPAFRFPPGSGHRFYYH